MRIVSWSHWKLQTWHSHINFDNPIISISQNLIFSIQNVYCKTFRRYLARTSNWMKSFLPVASKPLRASKKFLTPTTTLSLLKMHVLMKPGELWRSGCWCFRCSSKNACSFRNHQQGLDWSHQMLLGATWVKCLGTLEGPTEKDVIIHNSCLLIEIGKQTFHLWMKFKCATL